ncbi:MAG: hypothetical protein ACHQZS_06605 [Candidatus Binatales bacterium]
MGVAESVFLADFEAGLEARFEAGLETGFKLMAVNGVNGSR